MGKYKKYSRGTILLVDFGKNIGSEFNGKHFAIVLSKNDNEYSGKLSVIPLTSKDKRKRHVKINKSVINTIIQNAVNNALQKVYVYHQWYFLKKYIKNEKYMFGNFVLNYIHKRNALLIKIKEEELLKFFKEDTTALQEISKYYKKYNKFSFARVAKSPPSLSFLRTSSAFFLASSSLNPFGFDSLLTLIRMCAR